MADALSPAEPPTTLRDAVEAAAPRPVLIIAAGRHDAEIAAARAFLAAPGDNVEVWIAADTDHIKALQVRPAEWETRVVDFLDRSLASTPKG